MFNKKFDFNFAEYDSTNDRIIIKDFNNVESFIYFDNNGNFEYASGDSQVSKYLQFLVDTSKLVINTEIESDYDSPHDIAENLCILFDSKEYYNFELYLQDTDNTTLSICINYKNKCIGNINYYFDSNTSDNDEILNPLKSIIDEIVEANKEASTDPTICAYKTGLRIAKRYNLNNLHVIL